jgi:archaemetzincin
LPSDRATSKINAMVDLIPLGRIDPLAISVVAANLQSMVGIHTDILAPRPVPKYAFLPQRQQFDALKILKSLSTEMGGAPFKLGVTDLDICTPILTFVYGESQLGGKTALISLHRVHGEDRGLTHERAAKIGIHEVGHIFGLAHCWEIRCLMHFTRNLEQLDALPLRLCNTCLFEITRGMKVLGDG